MKIKLLSSFFLTLASCFTLQADPPGLYHLQKPLYQHDSNAAISTSAEKNIPLTSRETLLIEHVKKSIADAEKGLSKITPEILAIPGMSSAKNRHVLNNLCSLERANYLEIGCWKGSTFISALYNNEESLESAVGIDNWSEFGGPIDEFQCNCQKFLPYVPYRFFSSHSFSLKPKEVSPSPINIYFYDGDHSVDAHAVAFIHYHSIFDSCFIAIVDDWNWSGVREGTYLAFRHLNYEILYEKALPAERNGDLNNWWNGFYIAVIRKR